RDVAGRACGVERRRGRSTVVRRRAAGAGRALRERNLTMRAAVLDAPGRLEVREVPAPEPAQGQVLVEVAACAVCRTDLHVIDGELARPKLPLILGHQAVGTIVAVGHDVADRRPGDVVGIPWLG